MSFFEIVQNIGLIVAVFCFCTIPILSALSAYRSTKAPSPEEALVEHFRRSLGPDVSVKLSPDGKNLSILRR